MANVTFRRKIYEKFLNWKAESNGTTALLVEGARRIGKSTVVELFAKQEYESYILIDFNEASDNVRSLFNDLTNLDYIFLILQQTYHKTLKPRKSVIVFDEVQQCPRARQAIKYLVKDGRYDYIETGSLISIRENVKDITIPSEEVSIPMYPMDYEEFRWALGDEVTMPMLRKFWELRVPLKEAHRSAERDLRLYMLVGGMPQAVNEYIETNNLRKVDEVKRRIINLYASDFRKLDSSGRISNLFLSIPGQLSRGSRQFSINSILGKTRDETSQRFMAVLQDSKTVNVAYDATDPNVGMGLTRDDSRFKIYAGDTGLFVTMSFWDKDYTENVIYDKLLSDKLPANLGYVYENLVAQMIAAHGDRLFYHIFPSDEAHSYEVDFLLSRGSKLVPIEIKSSGYKAHASLDAFCDRYSARVGERYLFYTKDLAKEGQTAMIPFYMVPAVL